MNIAKTISAVRSQLGEWRGERLRVAFVPTMGNLHQGHLALVEEGFRCADRVVVSIFVNPLQFSAGEDFSTYPRTLEQDIEKLHAVGADCLFVPDVDEIYGEDRDAVIVEVTGISEILCGASRKGHFTGVTTVVAKLFNIVQPDVAVLGSKDFQQLSIIRRMVKLLYMPVEIIAVETRREPDGLAMSSRNRYLSTEQRAIAPILFQSLQAANQRLQQGERDVSGLEVEMRDYLTSFGFEVEYFTVRDAKTLLDVGEDCLDWVVLLAARLGDTRLIDNIRANHNGDSALKMNFLLK
ncbi:MAG: pantoate--beta-alanine ligase [Gammaproteobacteria bacterium]|nr:pantoate--beta-alanine ligase [Gammaproteobacteria bacterium]